MKIPVAVQRRLKESIPKFQMVLAAARDRDVNEADTVMVVADILEEVFGWDKYEDITREYAVQGTFIDLAVKTNNTIDYLIEVKAIGLSLKDSHLRQAINYAAKGGVKWAVLTNGLDWEIHRITVDQQVTNQQVLSFSFLDINARSDQDLQTIFLLCKKAVNKDLIEEYYEHKQAVNRYAIGTILLTDESVNLVRRVLRRINPALKVTPDEIRDKLINSVIKRDVLDSEDGLESIKATKRALARVQRAKNAK